MMFYGKLYHDMLKLKLIYVLSHNNKSNTIYSHQNHFLYYYSNPSLKLDKIRNPRGVLVSLLEFQALYVIKMLPNIFKRSFKRPLTNYCQIDEYCLTEYSIFLIQNTRQQYDYQIENVAYIKQTLR